MMKTWSLRPIEEAHLLNPAFCCVALTSSVIGYAAIEPPGMPYPLAFTILPIALHKDTREHLPRDLRTSLAVWIQENPEARLEFADRVIAVKPYTREAILFGLHHEWLVMGNDGRLRTRWNEASATRFVQRLNDEAKECVRRARFIGGWFASVSSAPTVMALWGIRP